MKKKEFCNNTNNNKWIHCQVCGGRIHNPGCSTKKRKGIDCFNKHTKEEYIKVGYTLEQ